MNNAMALSKIEAITGDCCTRGELRRAFSLQSGDVLELPPSNRRTIDGEEAWSKGLVRRWLRGELPRESRRTTERTVR